MSVNPIFGMEEKKQKKSISINGVGGCSISLSLDKSNINRRSKTQKKFQLLVCFTMNYKRYRHRLDLWETEKDFNNVCNVTTGKNALMAKKKEWEAILEGYRTRLAKVAEKQQLTLPLIRTILSGVNVSGEAGKSFIGVWESVIASRRKEGRAGTAENYDCALRSFRKVVGEVDGFSINKSVIAQWNDGMKNGVFANDKLVGKVSDTTRGIYLRACRVIWNECVKQGFLAEREYPFSNKNNDLVSIPRGKRRQQMYLNVNEMTELYKLFIDKKRFPKEWGEQYIEKARQSLGLFLAQYLCNGCNLTDIARMTYNKAYWQDAGKVLEFERKKTAARSSDNSVVIVPIIPPLKRILDDIAAKPVKGSYLFPYILKDIENEEERRRIILMENSNIRDRMRKICSEILGWEKEVSNTWARHSFATNLKLAGVEEEYIAESMGHSHGNDVTAGYMDMYPLEMRYHNNLKLLNIEAPSSTTEKKPDLNKLSKAEMKALLRKLLG